MEKLVYLLFDEADASGSTLRSALLDKAAPALRAAGAREISVFVHDEDVAAGTPLWRSDPPIRAMVSYWMEDADERAACEQALAACAKRLAGYRVAESRPTPHERPRGRRTPGMNQITCISRRPDLSESEFIRIWHQDHERVAIETQSTFGYVRNVVVGPLTEGAPRWDGIVEESFPIEALTDPRAFYAARSDEELKRNMERMLESCRRFLDFEPLEYTHMSEYYLG